MRRTPSYWQARPSGLGRLVFVTALAVAGLAAAMPACASRETAPLASAASPSQDWLQVSRGIAGPWPALQRPNGGFRDYLQAKGRPFRSLYGDAMLGYGLLQNGVRDGNAAQLSAGVKAITRGVRDPGPSDAKHNPFEDLAVAAAYNLARAKISSNPDFAAARAEWEGYLRRSRITQLGSRRPYFNYFLVEATLIVELLKTGLTSDVQGAVLADQAGSRTRALKLINTDLPLAAQGSSRTNPLPGTLAILPDLPRNPLAYHALQVGLLAHSIELLGSDAAERARALLRQAVDASWALAGPDGDLTYFGRSQELAWTLPITAYGAEALAGLPGTSSDAAARYRALAGRALTRLQRLYGPGSGRYGLSISPALRLNRAAALRGLDSYVGSIDYTGLTLVTSNWALEKANDSAPVGQLGADVQGSFRFERTPVTFATVRAGDVWYAVKERPTGIGDIRYDFGLIALKRKGGSGAWSDVLRLRPKTPAKGHLDSAGPLLMSGGRVGYPYGRGLTVGSGGVTSMKVDFRDAGGKTLKRGVAFRFSPVSCGVRISFPASAGERYEFSVFSRGSLKGHGRTFRDADQSITFGDPATERVAGGYASGLDPSLRRARFSFQRKAAGTASIQVC